MIERRPNQSLESLPTRHSPLATPHSPLSTRVAGRLRLEFEHVAPGGTRTRVVERRPPLAVVRAFSHPDGGALLHVHNVSGGVLGGDDLEIDVTVGPGARALITTPSATQLYRSADGREARQCTRVRVEAGGLLELLPDPLIPFAGSVYRQTTSVDLAEGASLYWWEIVAPGRTARRELFEYDRLALDAEIRHAGRLVALERIAIEPKGAAPTVAPRLGEYAYFGTFYVCKPGVEPRRWQELEERLDQTAAVLERPGDLLVGCSALAAHGLTVRALARRGRDVAAVFDALWAQAKWELDGAEAVRPRKTR
jgi:urease accessory protein